MLIWLLFLGLPILVLGIMSLAMPQLVASLMVKFPRNKVAGCVLCAVGWAWTAYECHTIGIEVFDKFLKAFPFELPLLAIVLTVLMCLWMDNLLSIRGLSAIFMLFPAELFPRLLLCDNQWKLVLVILAYACAIIGMFGMFYPWRIREALAWASVRMSVIRASGIFLTIVGILACMSIVMIFS